MPLLASGLTKDVKSACFVPHEKKLARTARSTENAVYPLVSCGEPLLQCYREAAIAPRSMDAPAMAGKKTSGSEPSAQLGETIAGEGINPEESSNEIVVKERVTSLLKTLSYREQAVRAMGYREECRRLLLVCLLSF